MTDVLFLDNLAWAAGLYEGEGSALRHAVSDKPVIRLATVDRDVADRFAAVFGLKMYGPYGPYSGNRQPYYQVDGYGDKARRALLFLYPALGVRRQRQVEAALA